MNLSRLRSSLLAALAGATLMLPAVFAADSAPSRQPSLDLLEKQFRQLPPEARRHTGPLFWLHGEDSRDRLQLYVDKVAEGGNGCFTTESRPHKDWLGPGWWRDLDICLAEAKKQNLQMWIFDEKWWPSQAVAGKVPPKYAAQRLEAAVAETEGPGQFRAEGYSGADYIATVAGRVSSEGKIEGSTLADLAPNIKEGKLEWPVPEGKWRVIKFTHKQAPGLIQQGGKQLSVDGASKAAVDWFLQTVYQPHYERYKAEFGKTIRGFFYDEPETPGDWGTELNSVLAERHVDWKKAYVAYKLELAGEEQVAARYQYLDAFAETWGRTMYGGITAWCRERGVQSIGHFMEHANLYLRPDFCAGDMMKLQGYSSMGGIDAVFDQFVMGKRVARDAPCWQTPKLASSISHVYGAPEDLAMVEIFGARGQDLTYPEMKWWADHMQVSGVNFLIPHSFNPRAPYDRDCPPYFYDGGYEPRWPLYRLFADYTSRLNLMLTGGRHVCPVALLFVGQSAQLGKSILPDQISESLQDALYDCDWLPYDIFQHQTTIRAQELRLRDEAYRVLIVPPVEVIPYETLAKVQEFWQQGGVVIGYGFLPSKSATLDKTSADVAAICKTVWGTANPGLGVCQTNASGGRSYLLPAQPSPEQLLQVLAVDAGVRPILEVLQGATDHWVHVLHRVKSGRDVFFVANQHHEGRPGRFIFRATADGVPECWDAMRNEITSVPFVRNGKQVEFDLPLAPNQSALLVFQPQDRHLPRRIQPGFEPDNTVDLVRDPAPAPQLPALPSITGAAHFLAGCSWVWYPEGKAREGVPPATRYFRKQVVIPASRKIQHAHFYGTADNSFTLYINGQLAGHSDDSAEGWRNPVDLDLTSLLHAGTNQLAIEAVNGGDKPNPAGLIGRLFVQLDSGPELRQDVDHTWKTTREKLEDWTSHINDTSWVFAQDVVRFGGGIWKSLADNLTLSPAQADPFVGHCDLSSTNLAHTRIYLELTGLKPENAARITVNGKDVGGFIGAPARIEVGPQLKPGRNTFRVEPFAPQSAKLWLLSLDALPAH